jgi:hypothetical protein
MALVHRGRGLPREVLDDLQDETGTAIARVFVVVGNGTSEWVSLAQRGK